MLYPATLPNLDLLWTDKRPDVMEAKLRALLEPARLSGIQSYYLQVMTQIARAQALQGKIAEASMTLDQVEADLCDRVTAAHIRYYLERGRIQSLQNHAEHAKKLFEKASRMAESAHLINCTKDVVKLFADERRVAS